MELDRMRLDENIYREKRISFLRGSTAEPVIQCFIDGVNSGKNRIVVNSVTERKEDLYNWKCKIAREIHTICNPPVRISTAAISLSFLFNPAFHGNRDFDVENFIKPVIDGIAKGMFGKVNGGEAKIHFNEDDSVFRWIYLERHDISNDCEGVFITVWENIDNL